MPGTTIAIAAAGGAVAAGAVARARDAECRAIIAGYDAQTATVEAQREYSHCVMQLHPDPLTGGQLIVAKAAVCVILAGVAIGAWVNRPGPYKDASAMVLGSVLGLALSLFGLMAVAGLVLAFSILFS